MRSARVRASIPLLALGVSAALLAGCQRGQPAGAPGPAAQITVKSGPTGAWTSEPAVVRNLATFDTLDFEVYSNQKWDRLKESHAPDIVVTWPDGRETRGLDQHIKDLSHQFTFAPDTRIKEHPIRIGVGEWTSVTGTMEGTFTRPMKTPDGKVVQPTNKPFKLSMVTVGHWTKDGVMDHEWLIWDNAAFMKQIGVGQ